MALAINRSDEEIARTAEYNVNLLWNKWSAKYRTKSPHEVLAMVSFKFAELYYQLNATALDANERLADFERRLDDILLQMDE